MDRDLLDEYCVGCHNLEDYAGGLAFDLLETERVHLEAETWEKVVRKLKAAMMPPRGEPRPRAGRMEAFIASLEDTLDAATLADPNPGSIALHRLNRAEYGNAIRDLLHLPFDATESLPADDSSAGFDNVANVLGVSPVLMQAYVSAAAKISRLAVGDPTTGSSITTYRSPGGPQARHREGMPLGTRGGLSVTHVFPLDAEYEISVSRSGNSPFALPPVGTEDAIELVLDGERAHIFEPGAAGRETLTIPAGPHTLQAAFLHTRDAYGVDDLNAVRAQATTVGSVAVNGPFNPTGAGDTPSRREIFTCRPQTGDQEFSCARQILTRLATRAYRRPVDAPSLDILMDFFDKGRRIRGFETGIQYALARILVDPQFIFRFEKEPAGLADGAVYPVDDYALASRLSFFLWSSIPDDELLETAGSGRLSEPAALRAQVRRMLTDERSGALVENFAAQWLSLRQLDSLNPATADFDDGLRRAMRRETELLFTTILREDRSVLDLIDADYTFVNERLARHYGMPYVRGSHFRRVELPESARRGLLGHAGILTLTSAPNRTSPVMRGKWVMENLLGTPPPPPPAGVETNLDETAPTGGQATTMRRRLERHRADPACAGCHGLIDPIGFALENFDAIGRWRNTVADSPIDAGTELWDGTVMRGPAGLRQALMAKRELFLETFTEKLMTYALGRTVEYYDMPAVRAIVEAAAPENYRLGALIEGIVESPAFRMKKQAPRNLVSND